MQQIQKSYERKLTQKIGKQNFKIFKTIFLLKISHIKNAKQTRVECTKETNYRTLKLIDLMVQYVSFFDK